MNFKDCDDMKSDDEYIVKIRDLCSQQGIFSWKESSALAFVFESLSGEPPDIHADRSARICTKVRQPKANSMKKGGITI